MTTSSSSPPTAATSPTRRLLPPFLQSPASPAAPSAPSAEPSPVVAGIAELAQRILTGADDPGGALAQRFPEVLRRGLEAALPMVVRQMSVIPEAELADGLRMFARELDRIAALGDVAAVDEDDSGHLADLG